jgi:two-component system, LytTR family, sensor kinase
MPILNADPATMHMRARDYLGFDDRLFMLIGIPATSAIMPFMARTIMGDDPFQHFWAKLLIGMCYTMLYWFSGRFVVIYLRKRLPGPYNTMRRVFWHSTALVALILFISLGCKNFINENLVLLSESHSVPDAFSISLLSIILSATILGVYEAAWAISKWKQSMVETERLRRENVQSQLDILKSQVNPHFLFNSLNTLSSLVHDHPDLSVEFIQKLSKTYRYVLEIKDKELISLEEEMECVNAYLFLLNIRFGEALEVHIDIQPAYLAYQVAPLSVQSLIENAIKHNVVARKRPLRLDISTDADAQLIVRNNLQVKDHNGESLGTGLANIRARYQLLVRKDVIVTQTADSFSVAIPLVKLEKYAPDHH